MKRIFKYTLEVRDGEQIIEMPPYCYVVCVGEQRGKVAVWCELQSLEWMEGQVRAGLAVPPSGSVIKRRFHIFGTGWDIPTNYFYHGTVQMGEFVWHLYEDEGDDD